MANREIIPAILTKDRDEVVAKIRAVEGLAKWVSIDIMDGIFVPQTTLSLDELEGLETTLDLEAHLMAVHPERLFEAASRARIRRVVVHIEALQEPRRVLHEISAAGMRKALAISPETHLEKLMPYADSAEQITFMGVTPGASGQQLIPHVLKKIADFKAQRPDIPVQLDGGVHPETIPMAIEAGVDRFIVNSALYESGEPVAETMKKLQAAVS